MGENKVLIVEDDRTIVDLIEIHLQDLGLTTRWAADGDAGLAEAQRGEYALIILDVMLPKRDGLDVCRQIRAKNTHTPILMLTAKSEELDKVLGLELGADDYVTKPFSVRELIARVKAILRRVDADKNRSEGSTEAAALQYADLVIDPGKRKVTLSRHPVELTPKEFELLLHFAGHPGQVYSRSQLLDTIWGYKFDGYDHTVNTHINRLRSKIEKDLSNPQYIRTVWGVGYRFAEREELEL